MKIAFFGSPQFAVPSLEALLKAGYPVTCVITQPDKRKGRGLSFGFTPVKEAALKHNIKVYQPVKINSPESVAFLKELNLDLFVIIAYGQILTQEVLDIPKIMPLNVHASLLPKYRGAGPVNWAIINGESDTGISVIKINRQMDAGPVILTKDCLISAEDTILSLEERLSALSAQGLLEVLKLIESNTYKLLPQDSAKATYAPKLKKNDGLIDWNRPAEDILRLIRGCLDWPGAFTFLQDKMLKIFKAKVLESQDLKSRPGEILEVSKNGIKVATSRGFLVIEELQPEAKRMMSVSEYISGHKIASGDLLKGHPVK